jgi:hypothetical protein
VMESSGGMEGGGGTIKSPAFVDNAMRKKKLAQRSRRLV